MGAMRGEGSPELAQQLLGELGRPSHLPQVRDDVLLQLHVPFALGDMALGHRKLGFGMGHGPH